VTADGYTFSIDYFANGDKGAKANDVLLAVTSDTTVPEPAHRYGARSPLSDTERLPLQPRRFLASTGSG
jgi:hypothetical protein